MTWIWRGGPSGVVVVTCLLRRGHSGVVVVTWFWRLDPSGVVVVTWFWQRGRSGAAEGSTRMTPVCCERSPGLPLMLAAVYRLSLQWRERQHSSTLH